MTTIKTGVDRWTCPPPTPNETRTKTPKNPEKSIKSPVAGVSRGTGQGWTVHPVHPPTAKRSQPTMTTKTPIPAAHRHSCPEQRMIPEGTPHAGWRVARCVGCDATSLVPTPRPPATGRRS